MALEKAFTMELAVWKFAGLLFGCLCDQYFISIFVIENLDLAVFNQLHSKVKKTIIHSNSFL